MKKILISLSLIFSLAGCSSMGVKEPTDEEINAEAAKAYVEVKSKSKISTNKEWNDVVQRVAKRIAAASGENFQWETVLIESPEVNAWCMPGGKIAVYTGIMPVLKTEAALAAVLGHEVAHATLRHGKQRYARAIKENIIGMVAGAAVIAGGQFLCKTDTCKKLSALGGVAAGFALTFFDRKYSRTDESAADKEGQIYMARAGYDPEEAPRLWDRMSAASGGKAPPEFMSTHPSDANRKAMLNEWMGDANQIYSQAPHKYGLGAKI
ncbi:MAG: M48 family metallopeptidase [Bacteriovorax sp.]